MSPGWRGSYQPGIRAPGLAERDTVVVRRERALQLAERVLQGLDEGQGEWPLSLVKELYVFGSFARGATEPHDVDIDVEHDIDQRWAVHFATCLAYGRDHFSLMKRPLTGGKRGCQFTFNFRSDADFAMKLLWRRGDPLAAALKRLHAIQPDPSEGRAPRDAMLAQFDGLDRWIPRPIREALSAAASGGAITVQRVVLADGEVTDARARAHLAGRWIPSSPLYRAAQAVVAGWERRGIDPHHGHLHGADIDDTGTAYYAGFGWRYFASIRACLTEHGGVEWLEVVHPTRTRPLDALRIIPRDRELLERAAWS